MRFRAAYGNEWLNNEIKKFVPKYGPLELYVELVLLAFQKHSTPEQVERKKILNEINALNGKISHASEMVISGAFDAADFKALKMDSEKKIALLEIRLPEISKSLASLRFDLNRAISNLYKFDFQTDNKKASKKGILLFRPSPKICVLMPTYIEPLE